MGLAYRPPQKDPPGTTPGLIGIYGSPMECLGLVDGLCAAGSLAAEIALDQVTTKVTSITLGLQSYLLRFGMTGPSWHAPPNTFSEGTWSPRVMIVMFRLLYKLLVFYVQPSIFDRG